MIKIYQILVSWDGPGSETHQMMGFKLKILTNNSVNKFYFKIQQKRFYDPELAIQHSLGNIDVNARVEVDNFNPDKWNVNTP